MCAQCMAGGATAVAGASGVKAWLAARGYVWMTPRRMRATTTLLVVAGLLGSSVGVKGT